MLLSLRLGWRLGKVNHLTNAYFYQSITNKLIACAYICNFHYRNGTLITSMFHKPAAEPYIVPFKSDHPWQIFKNVIDGVLKHAVRYSSRLSPSPIKKFTPSTRLPWVLRIPFVLKVSKLSSCYRDVGFRRVHVVQNSRNPATAVFFSNNFL